MREDARLVLPLRTFYAGRVPGSKSSFFPRVLPSPHPATDRSENDDLSGTAYPPTLSGEWRRSPAPGLPRSRAQTHDFMASVR